MERDRAYLRKQRKRKIKQRKKLIEDLDHNWYISPELRAGSKRDEVTSGEKDGYLATGGNGFIGSMGTHKKTNTRKGHASYRHSGDYGKADQYTTHDQRQIDAMEHDLKELDSLETENLTD